MYEHVAVKLPVCMLTKKLIKESCNLVKMTKKKKKANHCEEPVENIMLDIVTRSLPGNCQIFRVSEPRAKDLKGLKT